ncbi:MAG: hypothetical protein HZC28_18500 [Spirochaetes bacterium]|nr:hypothetical protein [Spirochaetota bacterium]
MMMKKTLLMIFIFGIVPLLFGSFLLNRNRNTLPEYERLNPTDKKATNYQGFETVDADKDGFPDFTVRLTHTSRTNIMVDIKGVGPGIVTEMAYIINGDLDTAAYIPFRNLFSVSNTLVSTLAFQLRLKFKNGRTAPTVLRQIEITNQYPTASFFISNINWTNKIFIATNSSDPDNALIYYAWDTDGDGNIDTAYSTIAIQPHYYTTLGTNTVTLYVKDVAGYLDTASRLCVRTNLPPVALFVISNANWTNKVFDASASYDPDGGALMYAWDTDGDGIRNTSFSSSNRIYTNIFTTLAVSNVILYVSDGFTTNTATNLCFRTNTAPVASFTITSSNATNKVFDASASYDPDGGSLTYAWDTDGNGSIDVPFSSAASNYNMHFTGIGSNNVILYIFDGFATNSVTNICFHTNILPIAIFSITEINATNKIFDASSSYDPDDIITGYAWDLDGNGVIDTPFSLDNIFFTNYFTNLGAGHVALYVRDTFETNMASNLCMRTNFWPTADFTVTPGLGSTNSVFMFNAGVSTDPDGNITTYRWDFNCDGTYEVISTSNSYSTNFTNIIGQYNVVLMINDAAGAYSIRTNKINIVLQSNDGLVFWNKLGSDAEVTNSAFGQNLVFVDTGNYSYYPGAHGNGIGMTDNDKNSVMRLSNVTPVLNPEHGTLEMWIYFTEDPLGFQYGQYRLWNGPGTECETGGVNLCMFDPEMLGLIYGSVVFNGTTVSVIYTPASTRNSHGHLNQWTHVALVWNRSGIEGTSDRLRMYIDGTAVAATNQSDWGTVASGNAYICSGVDWDPANKFRQDNIKVYTRAKTNFSDRSTE